MIFGRTRVALVSHIACLSVLQCAHLLVEKSLLILFQIFLGNLLLRTQSPKPLKRGKKQTVLTTFGWGFCSLPTTGLCPLGVCVFLCMYMRMCVWVCVEARGQLRVTFSGSLSNSSEAALSLDFSSKTRLNLLSNKPQGSSCVPLQYWGYTCVDTTQAWCMGSGIKLGFPGLWAFASCPITAGPFVNF